MCFFAHLVRSSDSCIVFCLKFVDISGLCFVILSLQKSAKEETGRGEVWEARWLQHEATVSDYCLQIAGTERLLKVLQRGTCCVSTPAHALTRSSDAGQEREVPATCGCNVKS